MRWLLLLAALPAPVFGCPTANDMERGVVFYRTDGATEVHRTLPDGMSVVDVSYSDGSKDQNTFFYGVFINSLASVENGVVNLADAWVYAYRSIPPVPASNTSGKLTAQTGKKVDGLFREVQTFKWGPLTNTTIGGCNYQLIEGQFNYEGRDYVAEELIHYLPELGTGLLMRYSDDSGADADIYEFNRVIAR